MEFVPQNGVLPKGKVGFAKQDKNSFNSCGSGLVKATAVRIDKVDIIIHLDAVRGWCRGSRGVQDARVEGVRYHPGEWWLVLSIEGLAPHDFVEGLLVLVHKGGVKEETLYEGGLDVMDGFLVCRAEVGAEDSTNLEKQILGKYVEEGTNNIVVVFDLAEA
jgi:hypothetical protein